MGGGASARWAESASTVPRGKKRGIPEAAPCVKGGSGKRKLGVKKGEVKVERV